MFCRSQFYVDYFKGVTIDYLDVDEAIKLILFYEIQSVRECVFVFNAQHMGTTNAGTGPDESAPFLQY